MGAICPEGFCPFPFCNIHLYIKKIMHAYNLPYLGGPLPILIFFGADLKSKMAATAEHSLT
jgi:hypothetical protein